MSDDIFIKPGERGLIVGMTGSGKSVMLQEQARRATNAPVIIMDTKIDEGFKRLANESERAEVVENYADYKKWLSKRRRAMPDYLIVRPRGDEVRDAEALDLYAQLAYTVPNSYFLVDEAYQLHKNNKALPGLADLLTRGRSRKIGVILCTQRPKWIDLFCLTECTKFYIYYLRLPDDRARIGEVMPYSKDFEPAPFHFTYYNIKEGMPKYYSPLDIPVQHMHTVREAEDDSAINWI